MKRILIFAALLLCVGLSSCQCSEKPDIGPVEGEEQTTILPGTPVSSSPAADLHDA